MLQRDPQTQNLSIILTLCTLKLCESSQVQDKRLYSFGLPVFWCALQVSSPSVPLDSSFPQPYVKSVCWFWQWACVCWNSDCCITSSFIAELLRCAAYALAKLPNWVFPTSLTCRAQSKGLKSLCEKKDTPLCVISIRPSLNVISVLFEAGLNCGLPHTRRVFQPSGYCIVFVKTLCWSYSVLFE